MSERDIITVSLPRQLYRDFENLPEKTRKRYRNFSDYVLEKTRDGIKQDLLLEERWGVEELAREDHPSQ